MNPLLVDRLVRAALEEDLGRAGDITSEAIIPADATTRAALVARKSGRVAGLDFALTAFRLLDPALQAETRIQDGQDVAAGGTIATLAGNTRAILGAERVALNYLIRLSGIATATARLVTETKGTKARIACTRKTTPGLRAAEKYAVACGGGLNHRFGLDDAVLIKDNHIQAAGGIAAALTAVKGKIGHLVQLEIEVDTLDQLDQVLAVGGADVVLLDNMDGATLAEAVRRVGGRLVTEASGNVRPETVAGIAATGVDVISAGYLTHSAPALDIGLDFEP